MGKEAIYGAGAVSAVLLGWGGATMLRLPAGDASILVAKIVFFYAPAAFAAVLAAAVSLAASVLFLRTKELRYDALAVSATEAGLIFLAVNLVTGCIWGHARRGLWWTWDPAISSALVCGLVYASYLMLRRAVEEPTQCASFSAVWSIFCFLDCPIAIAAVYRWRGQHPHPALWAGVPSGWLAALAWNTAGMLAMGVAIVLLRMRQEAVERELDSLRRTVHVI